MAEVDHFSVTLSDIYKVYGTPPVADRADLVGKCAAVNGVDLRVEHGTRLGIIGRNGAGKSTLLHLIAGIAEPSFGSLEVVGNVTSVMTLGVGLREEMTGRQNIFVDGELQGRDREETELLLDDIIDFADLGKFIDYPVRTYSTGMKARLAFSMISCLDPEILIIDEALSAGDAKFSVKAAKKIREICERGKIVFLVSHSMEAIRSMCDRCIWLESGRVFMDGLPEDVTDAYIDTVHKEDEAVLLERFRHLVGPVSHVPGFEISSMELIDERDGTRKTSIERGSNARVRAEVSFPGEAKKLTARIRIDRIDGLHVVEDFCEVAVSQTGQTKTIDIFMTPLPVGPGTFQIRLALVESSTPVAEYVMLLECYTKHALIGGKPALTHTIEHEVELKS